MWILDFLPYCSGNEGFSFLTCFSVITLGQWFSTHDTRLEACVFPRNLLEMWILGLHSTYRIRDSAGRSSNPCLHKPSRWSWCRLKCENHGLTDWLTPPPNLSPQEKLFSREWVKLQHQERGEGSQWPEWPWSKSLQIINAGEGVEKREPSRTVGGTINWYSHYGEQDGGSLKN